MKRTTEKNEQKRKEAIVVLVAVLAVPLLSMVAFAVDYGYLLKVETDLQRSAAAAALAAVQELIPAPDGTQDIAAARAAVRLYAASNTDDVGFTVLDADI